MVDEGVLILFLHVFLSGVCFAQAPAPSVPQQEQATADLRARIEASPKLPLRETLLLAIPPVSGWESGPVSGLAIGPHGTIYEVQRGPKSPPVLMLDSKGHVLRSWGEGQYTIPHSIRLDRKGNVWTVDAASSKIIKYSPKGKMLMAINVGGQPDTGSTFNGTTDIAFGPGGRLFIADGYGNARILEYTPDGAKLREWGHPGSGPGEMNLPHALQIDHGLLYVADRENGRIEKFNLAGRYMGEISHLGRIYSIRIAGDLLWASTGPFDQPPGAAGGWVLKLDRRTGKILGHLDLPQSRQGHALDLSPSGEPIITSGNELLWFKGDH